MNLIILPKDQPLFRYRPDSTLIRDLSVYYLPDQVQALLATPVLSIRMRRPGKAIATRFAERYWESFGFGLLLYPQLWDTEAPHREFIENAMDFTSLIPLKTVSMDQYPAQQLPTYQINGQQWPASLQYPDLNTCAERLSEVSHYCSLRIGDLLLWELDTPRPLAVGDRLDATWQEDRLWQLEIR